MMGIKSSTNSKKTQRPEINWKTTEVIKIEFQEEIETLKKTQTWN